MVPRIGLESSGEQHHSPNPATGGGADPPGRGIISRAGGNYRSNPGARTPAWGTSELSHLLMVLGDEYLVIY